MILYGSALSHIQKLFIFNDLVLELLDTSHTAFRTLVADSWSDSLCLIRGVWFSLLAASPTHTHNQGRPGLILLMEGLVQASEQHRMNPSLSLFSRSKTQPADQFKQLVHAPLKTRCIQWFIMLWFVKFSRRKYTININNNVWHHILYITLGGHYCHTQPFHHTSKATSWDRMLLWTRFQPSTASHLRVS